MATKIGTEASETINGTPSADTIHGKGGNDILFGLAGADNLYGGNGNDTLIGGAGKDRLWGGAGADTFKYLAFSDSRGTTVDLIRDFKGGVGGDKVDLTALGAATLESQFYPLVTGLQAVFSYNSTTDTTTLSYYQGSSTPVFQLKFTGFVDFTDISFLGISVSHVPTEGDDHIVTSSSAETIDLLGGDDFFVSLGGFVSVAGGSGNDQIFGGGASETLRGGSGDDLIAGFQGADILYGGPGNDELFGEFGSDTLYGGDGNDLLSEGVGSDGDDILAGQAGDDRMEGGVGNDTLNGGAGYDTALANDLPISVFSNYSITKNPDGSITLTDINGDSDGKDYGTDHLSNMEEITFWDGIYVIATNTFTPFDSVI